MPKQHFGGEQGSHDSENESDLDKKIFEKLDQMITPPKPSRGNHLVILDRATGLVITGFELYKLPHDDDGSAIVRPVGSIHPEDEMRVGISTIRTIEQYNHAKHLAGKKE